MAWSNNVFYIIFLSQIFLISHYIPKKLLGRMRHVLESYPPSEYPKLYPRPVERYKIAHAAFRLLNKVIAAIGLLTLGLIMFVIDHSSFADDGFISEIFPLVYGVFQFVPLVALELSEFSHLKLMRKANPNAKRKAELRKRRLTDIVSPNILGLTLALLIACIYYDYFVHDFVVSLGHDSTQRTIVLLITNFVLLAVGSWHLCGRKLNPHQSSANRAQHTAANLKSLLYVSMAMSLYFMTVAADDVYDMDFLDAILISVYFQVIIWLSVGHLLRSIKPEDIDFDVYKSDAAAT